MGGLDLPGGSSGTQAYVDLPNGLISGLTAVTFETWLSIENDALAWTRVFDFGNGSAGELTGPGGGASGTSYVFLGPTVNTNYQLNRVEIVDNAGSSGAQDVGVTFTLGEPVHYVVTMANDGLGDSTLSYWRNGVLLVDAVPAGAELADIEDVNNWLGRSNWTGDQNTDGTYDEFRIWDNAVDDTYVAASFAAGPSVVIPEPSVLAMLIGGGAIAIWSRRRRQ